MKIKKEILDKKILKDIRKFMVDKDINYYSHRENDLDIDLKYPKKLGNEFISKLIIFSFVVVGLHLIQPNFINEIKSTILTSGTFLILTFIVLYYVALNMYKHKIRKDRNIYVDNKTKRYRDYYDSKFQNMGDKNQGNV